MPMSIGEITSGLENKGFIRKNRKHRVYRYVMLDGTETTIITQCSHGARGQDVPNGTIGAMARQCRLSGGQFKRLVECPLEREGYEKLLLKSEEFREREDVGEGC